jgi:hypothetical protein
MLDQSVRTSPLGKDRLYNRYWFFRREGRIFVESADSKEWGYYSTKEEVIVLQLYQSLCFTFLAITIFMLNLEQLAALVGSLNIKGIRERALKQQLEKFYEKIRYATEVYPQIYFVLLDFVL